ncbi:MAG TPA: hypothetical protein DCM14_01250 [Clostridiales bacterium UBA8153]|nr:hypothetical protein [Clostridiales bacterium UBA8153]
MAGPRSCLAIGEGAAGLPPDVLRRWGCRWPRGQRRFLPPSEPTIRRSLQAIDPDWRAAVLHQEEAVLAQPKVKAGSNALAATQPLLAPLALRGKVVTAEARSAQVDLARHLVEAKGADYACTVKGNQAHLTRRHTGTGRG